jgi:RNA polymerase sigma factor (sigma-70 family)
MLLTDEQIQPYLYIVERAARIWKVRTWGNNRVEYDDLYQYGVMGLMDALKKYDDSKNASIESYVYLRVNGSILDALRRCDEGTRRMRIKRNRFIPLHSPEGEPIKIVDNNASAHYLAIRSEIQKNVRDALKYATKSCSTRDKSVIYQYFAEVKPSDIAKNYGVTAGRVTQICRAACDKMKVYLERMGIDETICYESRTLYN